MEWNRMKSWFAGKMDYFALKIDNFMSKISWSYHENKAIEKLNSIAQEKRYKNKLFLFVIRVWRRRSSSGFFFFNKNAVFNFKFPAKKTETFSLSRPQRK